MSEQANEQDTKPPATGDEAEGKDQAEQKPTDTVEFWRTKAREQEKRAKDNATAATELAQIKDAQKTDQERATTAREQAEKRATDAEQRATRLEVAYEKGLTPAQAKRLVGSTREELEADAEEVKRDFPVAPTPPDRTPRPDPSQGSRGGTTTSAADGVAEARKRFGTPAGQQQQ